MEGQQLYMEVAVALKLSDNRRPIKAMSLVDELKVTLKDLMPDLNDGVVLRENKPGAKVMQVSTRLLVALREYAIAHQVELTSVLRQLRDEIHKR